MKPLDVLGVQDQRILGVFDATYAQWSLGYDASQGGIGATFSDGVSQIKVVSSAALASDVWHHVAVSRAVDTLTVWVDGQSVATANTSATFATLSSDLYIGNNRDDENGWAGHVDEVRISNVARYSGSFLPAREFVADSNTEGLWSLDSKNAVIYDASSHVAHGEVTDGLWSDDSTCDVLQAAVSAGAGHTCGLDDTGSIWCLGDDRYGQSSPPGGTYAKVVAGRQESCAISTDRDVACWGNSTTLVGSPSSAKSVALGWFHGCYQAANNALTCWGIEDGSLFDFGQVSDAPAIDVVDVAAGAYFGCAVRYDGQLSCWGSDQYGQATPPSGTFQQVSAGVNHACALDVDGAVHCWGINDGSADDDRQVGDTPGGTFVAVSAGDYHSCALDAFGDAVCWGRDSEGQASPPSTVFAAISAGGMHSCGVDISGQVHCWGSDGEGQVSGGGSDTGNLGGGPIPVGECASLGLDGQDDFVDLSDSSQLPGIGSADFAIEMWARPSTIGTPMTLLHYGDDSALYENELIWLRVTSTGAVEGSIRGDAGSSKQATVTSGSQLTPDEWVHVHLQRENGVALRLYLDGVLVDSVLDEAGAVNFAETRRLLLGTAYDYETMSRSEFMDGRLRDVRIWSRWLTQQEIDEKRYIALDPFKRLG